jgi:hypothetical protein
MTGTSTVLATATTPGAPRLELLYEVSIDLEDCQQIGETNRGARFIFPLKGGTFSGPRLSGSVVAGGADWLIARADGVGELDVRGTLRTDGGALLYVSYRGYITNLPAIIPNWPEWDRVPHDEYYFVVTPYYETCAPELAWLTQRVCVGMGSLIRGGVSYRVFAVE